MNPTISLGRIAGVRIGVNWSWAIFFALIVWTLGSAVFPAQDPGLGAGAYAAMAIAAALLFYVSLLLHELGHARQARREGMEIEGITLWLFGGVARFRGSFPSAGAEFRIAVAGPLVTVVLGGVFVALAAAGHLPAAVDGVAAWLGYINLFLLAFNLLPALPLDGGRVLRSALWAVKGDFGRATALATDVSRFISVLLIGAGVVLSFAGGGIGGIWLALIGFFVLTAAGSEARYLEIRSALAGLKVRNLMIRHPVTAPAEATLATFMRSIAGLASFTAYPVVSNGDVVGVLPLARVLNEPRESWETLLVADCMLARESVPVLSEDEDALDGLNDLGAAGLHRGLVVDGGRCTGYISITDIGRALAQPWPPRPRAG